MYLSGQRSVKLFMFILLRGNEVVALAALCSLCFFLIACAEYLGMVLIYIDYRRQSWKCGIFNVSLDFIDFLLSNKVTNIGGNLAKARIRTVLIGLSEFLNHSAEESCITNVNW